VDILKNRSKELGIDLTQLQINLFERYYFELIKWNARINLTSVTSWINVQTKHFLDSLTVSLAIPEIMLESGRFVDIGTGGGFPGMPLKIAFPKLNATLIDSTAKKTAFLNVLNDTLETSDVSVLTGRSEIFAHETELRENFDFVLVRAVSTMAVLSELTLPFCRLGGLVVAQKALGIEEEINQSIAAIKAMGGELAEVKIIDATWYNKPRSLVVLKKINSTPEQYPRRPGMPKKHPLLIP